MSIVKLNTELYYENIIVPLQEAADVMRDVIEINDDLRYWYDFSERQRLQEFIDNCRGMKSEIESIMQLSIDSKKFIEDGINRLREKAELLPTCKIESRRRLDI